jgi:hypothetical protein
MNSATSFGFAMNATWEPWIVCVVAFIRSAMNRSASGWIELSCSETRNQLGMALQPGEVQFPRIYPGA